MMMPMSMTPRNEYAPILPHCTTTPKTRVESRSCRRLPQRPAKYTMPNYTSLIEMSTENFIHGDMKTLVIITITTPYRHSLTRNLLRALSMLALPATRAAIPTTAAICHERSMSFPVLEEGHVILGALDPHGYGGCTA